MPPISLAMIVWNEVLTLERTIGSVRAHVDEVVIGMDRASANGSAEIADRLADRVIETRLSEELYAKRSADDDPDWGFAKARNRVFDACKPDSWRLVLDGHETILNPERMAPAVDEAISEGRDGVESWMRFEPDKDNIPQTMFATARLMAPSVRYNGANHNVAVIRQLHVDHDLVVEHRKQDQAPKDKRERDRQRAGANIDGLRAKVVLEPENARAWYYLATAYKENARHGEAVPAFEECLRFSRWNEERWHARANMGLCLRALGEADRAREQWVLALEEFPPMAEAYYYLGELAYKQKRYREAQVWLEHCARMETPTCRLFVTPRIYLVDRHDQLSMVYHHLGRFADAIAQAERALETYKQHPRIETNIRLWRERL